MNSWHRCSKNRESWLIWPSFKHINECMNLMTRPWYYYTDKIRINLDFSMELFQWKDFRFEPSNWVSKTKIKFHLSIIRTKCKIQIKRFIMKKQHLAWKLTSCELLQYLFRMKNCFHQLSPQNERPQWKNRLKFKSL